MSFRRHVITGEPILFAPERAARPHAFTADTSPDERCPFCPGNEGDTPPEIFRLGTSARWLARVFSNKYPPAPGAEVIVEAPEHEARYGELGHVADLVRLYVRRYRLHQSAAYVALFKNEGRAAGSSITHVHSQLVPVQFVPARIARERDAFLRSALCPLCREFENVVAETDTFRWVTPPAGWMPYQQWIIPKRHVSEITDLTEDELQDLAVLLRDASAVTSRVGGSFNWMFMNFPRASSAHAYIDVVPRMTTIAGFELGTGTFVEIIDPASAAEALRAALRA